MSFADSMAGAVARVFYVANHDVDTGRGFQGHAVWSSTGNDGRMVATGIAEGKGVKSWCVLARAHRPAGGSPAQVTASHGPGIEPCAGNW